MNNVGQPNQYIPIFVSSTYEDMKEYRKAVQESLHKMETIVRGMEYFGSKPGNPKEECLKAVRSCKVYIGIFGMRYGSIDEETGKSMTHLEFEEAQQSKLPTLIYLIDEERQPILSKHFDTGDNAKKLFDLKKELKKRFTVSFFTSPEDLAMKISQDLPPVLKGIGVEVQTANIYNEINILDLINKFEIRPKKYAGQDIILEGVVKGDLQIAYEDTANALNLTHGDAILRKVYFPLLQINRYITAEGKIGDWLESVEEDTVTKMKIRLAHGTTGTVYWTEDGVKTRTTSIKGYKLIDIIGFDSEE